MESPSDSVKIRVAPVDFLVGVQAFAETADPQYAAVVVVQADHIDPRDDFAKGFAAIRLGFILVQSGLSAYPELMVFVVKDRLDVFQAIVQEFELPVGRSQRNLVGGHPDIAFHIFEQVLDPGLTEPEGFNR